jgi:hypothetical protein
MCGPCLKTLISPFLETGRAAATAAMPSSILGGRLSCVLPPSPEPVSAGSPPFLARVCLVTAAVFASLFLIHSLQLRPCKPPSLQTLLFISPPLSSLARPTPLHAPTRDSALHTCAPEGTWSCRHQHNNAGSRPSLSTGRYKVWGRAPSDEGRVHRLGHPTEVGEELAGDG